MPPPTVVNDAVARTDVARWPSAAPELCVVLPTLNEAGNIVAIVERVAEILDGCAWEVVVVDDDSPDGTADRVRALSRNDPRIRCLQRIGRRGLASACIEGMLATSAPYIAVMDADLQHDPRLLPAMLHLLKANPLDLVIGSRYVEGGRPSGLSPRRTRLSRFGTRFARLVTRVELADPLSGFFMLRRDLFEEVAHRLSGRGFKILLDVFASARRPLHFRELPYRFAERASGESKLGALVASEYLLLLADKLVGHILPVRFILFALVGGFGFLVHMTTLGGLVSLAGVPFTPAQAAATLVAMTSNFFLNNIFTYSDRRLRGRRLVSGLLTFYAICTVGAVANVGIAAAAFRDWDSWWLAGAAGAVVGSVWNYAMSSAFAWNTARRPRGRSSKGALDA